MERFGRSDRDSVVALLGKDGAFGLPGAFKYMGKDATEVGRFFDTWMIRHAEVEDDEHSMVSGCFLLFNRVC